MIYGVSVREMAGYDEADHAPVRQAFLGHLTVHSFDPRDVLQGFRCTYGCCDDPFPRRIAVFSTDHILSDYKEDFRANRLERL